MSDETTLLPCPFCGGEAEVTSKGRGQFTAGVRCKDTGCGCRLHVSFRSRAEAIAAWNARAAKTIDKVKVKIEPDVTELTQNYDAGFRTGVMAVFQQLEGIEDYKGLQCFIAEYWREGEGYGLLGIRKES